MFCVKGYSVSMYVKSLRRSINTLILVVHRMWNSVDGEQKMLHLCALAEFDMNVLLLKII